VKRGRLRRREALRRGAPLRRVSPRRKYGNRHCSYAGRTYDSILEARYAAQLDMLKRAANPAERVAEVKRQVNVRLYCAGKYICTHVVDFQVTFGDGRVEYHEVKGFEAPEWRIKRKLFEANFPDTRYVVIRKGDVR
jgi:hypothetical protein